MVRAGYQRVEKREEKLGIIALADYVHELDTGAHRTGGSE